MQQGVTLDSIGGGALRELFGEELANVLANIADPNTDASAKRSISITVTFTPNGDRDVANVTLTCSAKLAGIKKVSTQLYMGTKDGKRIAVENDVRQSNLFDPPKPGAATGTTGELATFPRSAMPPNPGGTE